jgi:hypothetical protein
LPKAGTVLSQLNSNAIKIITFFVHGFQGAGSIQIQQKAPNWDEVLPKPGSDAIIIITNFLECANLKR